MRSRNLHIYKGLRLDVCSKSDDIGLPWLLLKLVELRLMDKILHDPKDPKLWELWYIPYYG